MTYIKNAGSSPFATCSISGSESISASPPWKYTTAFDTPSTPLGVFNSTTKAIDTSQDCLAFASFSPNNNTVGGFFNFSFNPELMPELVAMVLPEVGSGTAGGLSRGDDTCIDISKAHKAQYVYVSTGAQEAPDKNRSIMYMLRIGV